MTRREGECCQLCGYPVMEAGASLCRQCEEFQEPAKSAAAAGLSIHAEKACRSCGASSSALRRKDARNGGRMFAFQCAICGASTSSWLKRELITDPEAIPPWDESLRGEYWRRTDADRQQKFEAERDLRRVEYHAYLKTPKWKAIAQRVNKRANGICEGCGLLPLSEVHHLTYDHVGDEFLFELVGLCSACHARYHGQERQGAA